MSRVWLIEHRQTGKPLLWIRPFKTRQQARIAAGRDGRVVAYVRRPESVKEGA